MAHLARLPAYGRAFCPHCEAELDLAQAAPTFGERFRKEVYSGPQIQDSSLSYTPSWGN